VILLDSSAVLAMLQGETGADAVVQALAADTAAMSVANMAEVLAVLSVRGGVAPKHSLAAVRELDVKFLPVTEEIATESAEIATRHPRSGLSLGDRLCLATGSVRQCRVLTADRAWLALSLGIDIESIR
jgi:ribonuclease VapC